jgi:hypothetical protein
MILELLNLFTARHCCRGYVGGIATQVHARRYANMDEVVENTAEDGQLFMHAR